MSKAYINLRELRKKAGLTQVELAQRIGAKQPDVSKIENQLWFPSVHYLLGVLQVLQEAGLDCTFDDLVRPSPEKLNLTPQLV